MTQTEKRDGDFLYNVGKHTLRVIETIGNTEPQREKKELQILRYAALLHETENPKEIMQRLKFDNETIDYVVRLTAAHGEYLDLCASSKINSLFPPNFGTQIRPRNNLTPRLSSVN